MAADAPKLSLPGKLVFPSASDSSHFSMLGLGDIVSAIFTLNPFSVTVLRV